MKTFNIRVEKFIGYLVLEASDYLKANQFQLLDGLFLAKVAAHFPGVKTPG
jgi:hypothetical protein